MTNFFLQLPANKAKFPISYSSKIFLMGSCFVENIGQKLQYHKLQTRTNPFGIIFHPLAIIRLLERCVEKRFFNEEDLFFANERWQSFEVHSKYSHTNKKELLQILNKKIEDGYQFLKETTHFVCTLGTAWGYQERELRIIVANCHKIPQSNFNKVVTPVDKIKERILDVFEKLLVLNPSIHLITTVSPVRHIKDGIVENNRSKALLLQAVSELAEQHLSISYYPAYELVIDCLRDYRFYKSDLVHPNAQAIQYIWEHFVATYMFENKTAQTLNAIAEIQRGISHKPFNSKSEAHQKFVTSLQEKIKSIITEFPFMHF